jgi:hypothetical protein
MVDHTRHLRRLSNAVRIRGRVLESLATHGLLDVRVSSDIVYRYAPVRRVDEELVSQIVEGLGPEHGL